MVNLSPEFIETLKTVNDGDVSGIAVIVIKDNRKVSYSACFSDGGIVSLIGGVSMADNHLSKVATDMFSGGAAKTPDAVTSVSGTSMN